MSDIAIHFEADAAEARNELNAPVIRKTSKTLEALAQETGQPTGNLLSTAVRSPTPCRRSKEAFDKEALGRHSRVGAGGGRQLRCVPRHGRRVIGRQNSRAD